MTKTKGSGLNSFALVAALLYT